MQNITRVLLKVNLDEILHHNFLCTFGAEPKLCTGYKVNNNLVAIPLKTLIRDGFSFHHEDSWYEKGSIIINDEPCYYFWESEVNILTQA